MWSPACVMADPRLLFDVNALVALALTTHQHHRAAHSFLAQCERWATCPTTEASLLRLLLNPVVTGTARSAVEVRTVLSGMRQDPRWRLLPETAALGDPVVDLRVLMGHQQVTDLHLVNVAAASGARLATFDASMPTWLAPRDRRHVVVIPV